MSKHLPAVPSQIARASSRIKLTLIPGNRVVSEWMSVDPCNMQSWFTINELIEAVRQGMIRQFKLRPADVSVVSMYDANTAETKFRAMAHLTPLGPEHTTEAGAIHAFRSASQPPEVPDYIDI